uniref:Uncharacterized protein n=1 Tax=Hyaloperonospora arabidopsidis (strain Emoy2) TaxID=559515 RepID=M4BF65_HYAAE
MSATSSPSVSTTSSSEYSRLSANVMLSMVDVACGYLSSSRRRSDASVVLLSSDSCSLSSRRPMSSLADAKYSTLIIIMNCLRSNRTPDLLFVYTPGHNDTATHIGVHNSITNAS